MTEAVLRKRIAQLEFEHDQLLTELSYVDRLLRSVGFSDGLQTVKGAVKEIIDKEGEEENPS